MKMGTHTPHILLTDTTCSPMVQFKTVPDLALLFLLGRQDGGSHTSNSCSCGHPTTTGLLGSFQWVVTEQGDNPVLEACGK